MPNGLRVEFSSQRSGYIVICLETMLRAKDGNTLRGKRRVFTRSAITPPKVNRFG